MVISQYRGKRSPTGSRYRAYRKKKLYERGRLPSMTVIGDRKCKRIRVQGANLKQRLLKANIANVYDPKTKKYSKLKIMTVVENPANRNYVRRSILTKGTVVKTEKGSARITSRPGQDGTVNAVLV